MKIQIIFNVKNTFEKVINIFLMKNFFTKTNSNIVLTEIATRDIFAGI